MDAPLPEINHAAIAAATADELERWIASLATALAADRPDDEPPERWDAETEWVRRLRGAIKAEIDRRVSMCKDDRREDRPARTRAAI